MSIHQENTTFRTALPYGVTSITIGVIGATMAVIATATAIKIIGVIAAIIGAYGFIATIICGLVNAGNPQKFKEEYSQYAVTIISAFIADLISKIAIETISHLLDKAFGRTNNSLRISSI